jgi:hypothetical protein
MPDMSSPSNSSFAEDAIMQRHESPEVGEPAGQRAPVTLKIVLPSLPSVNVFATKPLLRYYKAMTNMYWQPVKNSFPLSLLNPSSPNQLDFGRVSNVAAVKTSLMFCAEMVAYEFGEKSFDYKYCILKSLWPKMNGGCPALLPPKQCMLQLRHSEETDLKAKFALTFLLKPHIMSLPTLKESLDSLRAQSSQTGGRVRSMGCAATIALARAKGVLRDHTSLAVTCETRETMIRKLWEAFSAIGKSVLRIMDCSSLIQFVISDGKAP